MARREDVPSLADALDRALALRRDDGAPVVTRIEHVADVRAECLFGRARARAPRNLSTRPDAMYACEGGVAIAVAVVGAIAREAGVGGWTGCEDAARAARALCANGDHASAWNARKRALERAWTGAGEGGGDVGDAERAERRGGGAVEELGFASAAQSRFPKAPSAWAHRRWVLERVGDAVERDRRGWFRRECDACDAATASKRSNYAAWAHRAWALSLLGDDADAVGEELRANEAVARRSVGDHCALHYRARVIERYLELRPSESSDAIARELETTRALIAAFPGHEALWSHLRYAFAKALSCDERLASDETFLADLKRFARERLGGDSATLLEPAWAEHAAATERRLAEAFEAWTNFALARSRGERAVATHVRATDGATISSD